jgi:ATP-binding protein involved in chromosome partitioning
MGMPFLGEVPLDMAIRETSDMGRPVVATDPGGPQAAAFRAVAREILIRTPALRGA